MAPSSCSSLSQKDASLFWWSLEPSLNPLRSLIQPLDAGVPVLLCMALVEQVRDSPCHPSPAGPPLVPGKYPVPLTLTSLRVQAHLSSVAPSQLLQFNSLSHPLVSQTAASLRSPLPQLYE